ncbi:hypothetical protein LA635_p1009 (plasmid) [Erwinia amylovora LA635]|uniref:Uncharacterized protein n=1 Tax=Erwinia amylovora TaxID=552 RepID=A0A0P0ZI78_ERWAM|nr:hypothetical protein LA635_p1009 [Erwinia amylovora LA635]CDK23786.1 hypothetical protein LA636_p1008 [Erwinia amylovora LA636]CDK23836.1 hypothetical protein LA637_p1009 [Erwinia amylovora LA637]CDM08135.1 hypothetical protein EAMY692_p20009 [Erwinia amylovora]
MNGSIKKNIFFLKVTVEKVVTEISIGHWI